MTSNTLQITPLMHIRNLPSAVDFLEDVLGFETIVRMRNYAYRERQGAARLPNLPVEERFYCSRPELDVLAVDGHSSKGRRFSSSTFIEIGEVLNVPSWAEALERE